MESVNIDYLKWKIEKADGFNVVSYYADALQLTVSFCGRKFIVGSNSWRNVYYPLLLQRAIEGVNRECETWEIQQNKKYIRLKDKKMLYGGRYPKCFDYSSGNGKAKQSALQYIYEQETKCKAK